MFTNYEIHFRLLPLDKHETSEPIPRGVNRRTTTYEMIGDEFQRIFTSYGIERYHFDNVRRKESIFLEYSINCHIDTKSYNRVLLLHKESIFTIVKTAFSVENEYSVFIMSEIEYSEINA